MAESYTDYQKKIQEVAAQTRNVTTPDISSAQGAANLLGKQTQSPKPLGGKGGRYTSGGKTTTTATTTPSVGQDVASAAVQNYQNQILATQKQAEKAAAGLEMVGGATEQYISNLDKISQGMETKVTSVANSFSAAAEKADEYVQAARGRVTEVLNKLDEINTQIAKDRDFGKAHAMQAAVQSSLNSMKAEERNILETYGVDSKEYQQFQQSKQVSLATIQSNIQANYQQLAEEQGKTYLSLTQDAYTKSNMYLGYQEQQHVDMLQYQEQAKSAYAMQVAQFQTGIEQLKMAGMENLANWMIETPVFSMDSTPLLTLIADLAQTEKANTMAEEQMRRMYPQTSTKTINYYPGFKSL